MEKYLLHNHIYLLFYPVITFQCYHTKFAHLFTFLCIRVNRVHSCAQTYTNSFLHLYVSKIHSLTLISIYKNSTQLRKFSKRDEAISSVL